jgi:cobyrinic acid a,c-diamide synthase
VTTFDSIPRLVISGTASGVGKTTVTAGLIAALRQRGLTVQAFKCGPDYIDPTYHTLASGRPCRNLDAWMLNEAQLGQGFVRACAGADLAVIEGVMGAFDGAAWESDEASTAHIARMLRAPMVLVLDISGAARSAAIEVAGFQHLDPNLKLSGVILNQAGSKSHAEGCAQAIEALTGVRMLGWLARDGQLAVPERHLGLKIPNAETEGTQSLIRDLGDAVAKRFDIEGVLAAAGNRIRTVPTEPAPTRASTPEAPVLAVARDEAFCFYYPENLELLEEEGVQLQYFSPIRGEIPAADAAGVYFGGGYPELHARALSANERLWTVLKELHRRDAPIYAECGGFMVLMQELTDVSGASWPMAGILPGRAQMSGKLEALGYRWAEALRSNLITTGGTVLKGHEFHYSRWISEDTAADRSAWRLRGTRSQVPDAKGGFVQGNLLASYVHIHFGQDRSLARRFATQLKAHT